MASQSRGVNTGLVAARLQDAPAEEEYKTGIPSQELMEMTIDVVKFITLHLQLHQSLTAKHLKTIIEKGEGS